MAGPPPAGQPAPHAHPTHFEKNVLYEFDEKTADGQFVHRKIKARGFIVKATDLATGNHIEIDLDKIKNIQRFMGVK